MFRKKKKNYKRNDNDKLVSKNRGRKRIKNLNIITKSFDSNFFDISWHLKEFFFNKSPYNSSF